MKQVASIYMDKDGHQWLVQKMHLPRKKGYYTYWTAEQIDDITLNKAGMMFKAAQKADVLKNITGGKPKPIPSGLIRGDSSPSILSKG